MNFDALFVNPNGRTSRAHFIPALVTLALVIAFFAYLVLGRTGQFCMLVLMYPLYVLLARRMQDMGQSAWLLLVPLAVTLVAFASKLHYVSLGGTLDGTINWIALAVAAAFALWGSLKP